MANRVILTFVFTLSFLTYMGSELSIAVQLVPLILFAVLVFIRVLGSDSVLRATTSLLEIDGLFFVLFLSLFILGPSIASTYEESAEFSVLICLCLILARLYMAVVPLREVIEAFFWSGLFSIGIFVSLSLTGLMQSIVSLERFSPFGFHPNLLAFLLAGYLCVMFWKVITGNWPMRILAALAAFICLVLIFFTSSRGAILSILAGFLSIATMTIVRASKAQRTKLLRIIFLVTAGLIGLLVFFQNSEQMQNAYAYVDHILELTNDYRGIGSGLSGRMDSWRTLTSMLPGTLLLGRGMRASELTGTIIDNSYLVILYDLGVIPLVLITCRFLGILRASVSGYFRATDQTERYVYLACSFLLAVLLLISVVERYLFAVGNPFSLLALLFFAAPTRKVAQCLNSYTPVPMPPKLLANGPTQNS